MTTTAITVRVQARGGKFLGDDIGGALVTIRDSQSGELLATGTTSGDSGTLQPSYAAGYSQLPIITPSTPTHPTQTIQWLQPDAAGSGKTSYFGADLKLTRPTLLEISAYGPLGGLQSANRVTVMQWMVPGQDLTGNHSVVMELTGLLLQALVPPTHWALQQPTLIQLMAQVTMMCGCEITNTPAGSWDANDFDVTAGISLAGQGNLDTATLLFVGASSFSGAYNVTKQGFYTATFFALQKSTGNTGTASVTFYLT